MTATTIKVPADLRDRLNAEARGASTTVAGVIERLLDERDRAERFRRIREAREATTRPRAADAAAEFADAEAAAIADLDSAR